MGTKQQGGARPGAGRKKREELGLPPVKNTTVQVEQDVIDRCREIYGSLANALRYAATASSNGKNLHYATTLQK